MGTVFVATTLTAKDKDNKTGDINKVMYVDVENNKIAYADVSQAKIPGFNTITRRYVNDNVPIEETVGTLAFVNTEYRFYGVLKMLGNKPYLVWITEEDLKVDKNYNLIANINNKPYDITHLGKSVFNKNWLSVTKQLFVSSVQYKLLGYEKFMEIIGSREINKNDVKPINNVKPTNISKVSNNKSVEESINNNINANDNNSDKLSDIEKDIIRRLVEIEKREESLAKKEAELSEKSTRLSNILAKIEGNEIDNIISTIIDIDELIEFDVEPVDELTKSDFAIEMSIKMLNHGDVISIHQDYFKKLHCLTKKTLESNLAYTNYKIMASIKFERNSEYSVFGIVEYNSDSSYVKFNVLKPFSNKEIKDEEVANYFVEYTKWRKSRATN